MKRAALDGERKSLSRRSVRLEADIPLVRLKPDATYSSKTLSKGQEGGVSPCLTAA